VVIEKKDADGHPSILPAEQGALGFGDREPTIRSKCPTRA
jgi:hypothetical protein